MLDAFSVVMKSLSTSKRDVTTHNATRAIYRPFKNLKATTSRKGRFKLNQTIQLQISKTKANQTNFSATLYAQRENWGYFQLADQNCASYDEDW